MLSLKNFLSIKKTLMINLITNIYHKVAKTAIPIIKFVSWIWFYENVGISIFLRFLIIINVFLVNDNGRYTNENFREKQRNYAYSTYRHYNSFINIGTV